MLVRTIKFALVGGGATFVHISISFMLVRAGLPAIYANIIAFGIAFLFGFSGHLFFSFMGRKLIAFTAFRKYLITALFGFSINETLLVVLENAAVLPSEYNLLCSTICVAGFSFMACEKWAFKNIGHRVNNI